MRESINKKKCERINQAINRFSERGRKEEKLVREFLVVAPRRVVWDSRYSARFRISRISRSCVVCSPTCQSFDLREIIFHSLSTTQHGRQAGRRAGGRAGDRACERAFKVAAGSWRVRIFFLPSFLLPLPRYFSLFELVSSQFVRASVPVSSPTRERISPGVRSVGRSAKPSLARSLARFLEDIFFRDVEQAATLLLLDLFGDDIARGNER